MLPACLTLPITQAAELRGQLDLRATHSERGASSAAQAVLRADQDLAADVTASVVVSAGRQRDAADVREAWLEWSPVPTGAWKIKVRLGAFFPRGNTEIDYDDIAWTPSATVSSSAINSWIGEELRTKGVELQMLRLGRSEASPHDIGFSAALYRGNDPTGTLLAWRGWSISDRIAGLHEQALLPDLPVYRSDGAIPRQSRSIHPFRELDGRTGYYLGAGYRYGSRLDASFLHYDNRANPLVVKAGQYAWHTRFNGWSAAIRPPGEWEFMAQAMRGSTLMGDNAVAVDFDAWFAMAVHPLGAGRLALRYDRFSTSGHDVLPGDANDESGHALALAYRIPLHESLEFIAELLHQRRLRPARRALGEAPRQRGQSVTAALRLRF